MSSFLFLDLISLLQLYKARPVAVGGFVVRAQSTYVALPRRSLLNLPSSNELAIKDI